MKAGKQHIIEQKSFCDCMPHPFQHEQGVSQRQRIMDNLLAGNAQIDSRKMADLLDYFYQLSRNINHYDNQLNISDWRPFFDKSIPFVLASLIKYNYQSVQQQLNLYKTLFAKRPSTAGLQLMQRFIYYNTIRRIYQWYVKIQGSGLPVERVFESIIKDKIRPALIQFIALNRMAANVLNIEAIDFREILGNDTFNISNPILIEQQVKAMEKATGCDQLPELYNKTINLFSAFFEPIRVLTRSAELSLDQSFDPLKDELHQKQLPHLALLFAFLKLFSKLQNDLNGFTKKHLDYFYRTVLRIKPKEAVPDKAHIVIEIQKELDKYLLEKGLLVKDGKDINKQEIQFAFDDEIVVNRAQVKDIRALYLNNQPLGNKNLLEGLYMAPDLTKADGVEKDFQSDVRNYYTLGNKESKYQLPGSTVFKPYPSSRLGFVLASPVLFLQEGVRTVTLNLSCEVDEEICDELKKISFPAPAGGCDCENTGSSQPGDFNYPNDVSYTKVYHDNNLTADKVLTNALNSRYYYVSQELIAAALKKGLSEPKAEILRNYLTITNEMDCDEEKPYCYFPTKKYRFDTIVAAGDFEKDLDPSLDIMKEFFKKRTPFSLLFSGEKEWISPSDNPALTFTVSAFNAGKFTLTVKAVLNADKPAVTFYDSEKLKEELQSASPLVKLELDDHFKTPFDALNNEDNRDCCLKRKPAENKFEVSLYHFFKKVKLLSDTSISVHVCGLKKMIVQNDESVMDPGGPFYAFGVRPKINSNFFIGSEEVFLKKWTDVWVNVFWKDKPDFTSYYSGYQTDIRDDNGKGKVIKTTDKIKEEQFLFKAAILQDGTWHLQKTGDGVCTDDDGKATETNLDLLFPKDIDQLDCFENSADKFRSLYTNQYHFGHSRFDKLNPQPLEDTEFGRLKKLDTSTRNSFLRLTLRCQDFRHDQYSRVLARQLSAEAKLSAPSPSLVDGAVYYGVDSLGKVFIIDYNVLFNEMDQIRQEAQAIDPVLFNLIDGIMELLPMQVVPFSIELNNKIWNALFKTNLPLPGLPTPPDEDSAAESTLYKAFKEILKKLVDVNNQISSFKARGAVIPREPWTPTITNIAIDYHASASAEDIDLIHLYPFKDTFKHEVIKLSPSLLPTFCDEGTLYLGLENLVPGSNLNILFQLAEATADSESDKEKVYWHYLESNVWKPLRTGFEILNDATENLTTSGIIQFAIPENMTTGNTIMPPELHWIKATIPENSKLVSETTGIHAQAIRATFTNLPENDKLRLSKPLDANLISKLVTADASVKKILQPYETFGGLIPEEEQLYYVRVSEHLRHKGRANQKFDYERIVLDAFPQIFKTKCINHSLGLNAHEHINDFPYAPGHVLLAVIPDLTKLKAGNAFEPKAPVSLLEKIDEYVRKRTSPFVRFRSMNPRYEKIHLCLKVRLVKGKDENYYKEKLAMDIRTFLAPWAIGDPYSYKLTFGQCVNRSNIIGFLESLDYIDFILALNMRHELSKTFPLHEEDAPVSICPATPRSILIAGDIDICIADITREKWGDTSDSIRPVKFIECKSTPNS